MTEPKKKKNDTSPRLLYHLNQAFIDGERTEPYHNVDIKRHFAERHGLSTLAPHEQSRRPLFGCIMVIGIIMTGFFTAALSVFLQILINNYSFLTLAIIIIFASVIILCLWLTYKAGIEAFRYNPKRVQILYDEWLKRGEIIHGRVTRINYDKGKANIHYAFEGESKREVKGRFSVEYAIGSQSGGILGKSIYILYADKKLHAPL